MPVYDTFSNSLCKKTWSEFKTVISPLYFKAEISNLFCSVETGAALRFTVQKLQSTPFLPDL